MRNYLRLFAIVFVTAFSCHTPSKTLNVLIYTDFINPQKTYEAFREEIVKSGLIDSIYLIGRPVFTNSLKFTIDTVATERMGLTVKEAKEKIFNFDEDELIKGNFNQSIITNTNKRIPISAIAKFYSIKEPYKPEFFKTEPESFYYNKKRAVKLVIFCKPKKEKEVKALVSKTIHNYAYILKNYQFKVQYEVLN